MVSEQIQKQVLDFIERCQNLQGKTIKIQEAISVAPVLFDRHSTAYVSFSFVLNRVGWRISGGMLMLEGEDFLYEIGTGRIVEFNESANNRFEIFEQYSDTCYRRTHLQIL